MARALISFLKDLPASQREREKIYSEKFFKGNVKRKGRRRKISFLFGTGKCLNLIFEGICRGRKILFLLPFYVH